SRIDRDANHYHVGGAVDRSPHGEQRPETCVLVELEHAGGQRQQNPNNPEAETNGGGAAEPPIPQTAQVTSQNFAGHHGAAPVSCMANPRSALDTQAPRLRLLDSLFKE